MADRVEIFEHPCLYEGCIAVVQFDNQPFCEYHSVPSVTEYVGYSARREYNKKLLGDFKKDVIERKRRNIFDKDDNESTDTTES